MVTYTSNEPPLPSRPDLQRLSERDRQFIRDLVAKKIALDFCFKHALPPAAADELAQGIETAIVTCLETKLRSR